MKTIHLSVEDSTHWKFMQLKDIYKCPNMADAFTKVIDECYIYQEEFKARKEEEKS